MNTGPKLALLMMMTLLVEPLNGLGQHRSASSLESLVTAAQQAQAVNDFSTAIREYKEAVKIEPMMPELWANLGLMQQQASDMPAAIASFHRSNALSPRLYVPNLFLGIDLVRTGEAAEAIPLLTRAERINKSDPQAPLALGRAYFATGNFSRATGELSRAIKLDPKLDAAWFALGIARLNQVEADAHKMSAESKNSAFAGALYAESLEKQARFSEAATLYRTLLSSPTQPPCVRSELGFALLLHHDLDGADSEFKDERAGHPECSLALLGEARLSFDRGDREQGMKVMDELWIRDRGFVRENVSTLLEGMSSGESGGVMGYLSQPDLAVTPGLQKALLAAFDNDGTELNDDSSESGAVVSGTENPSAAGGMKAGGPTAAEYYAAGEFEHCANSLDSGAYPTSVEKLRLLAACSFFRGDDEGALRAGIALESLATHAPEGLYWAIQANQRLALKSLAYFQKLDSNSARSHVLLGDIYYQLERYDDAHSEYSKALAIAPGDAAALLGLATAYLSNNDTERAMETARIALERDPEDAALNLVVAEALVSKNQFAEAEPFLKKSLTAKPQMLAHVHALLGKAYSEMGRTREAIEQLRMSTSGDDTGSIHYLLARLYRQVGDTKDATAALEDVKRIKQQRRDRGVKRVEDPDLTSLEVSHGDSPDR